MQPRTKRRHSIVSVGGGQKMNVIYSDKPLNEIDHEGDYKKLYHDENRGVDVYVFTNKYDPNEIDVRDNYKM
eukprot:UN11485